MTKIEAPTNCPSCSAALTEVNDLLYCRNSECGAQASKRLEHFASTLKIKGLGPVSISKLNLYSLTALYELELHTIETSLASLKLAEKLLNEIERSKTAPLNVLLPAFSIPLIGKTAAEKLSRVCIDIEDIDYDNCRTAGLGEKATNNLLKWITDVFPKVADLPFSFAFIKPQISASKEVVCITGKLTSFKTKAEANLALKELGYEIKSSLTKAVTILVNESGVESTKTRQARASGVTIINNLKDFIGE
jgi:DNA ligase (NAD+)